MGHTSSSCARRRMLSASSPSASTTRTATSRIRSRESLVGAGDSTVVYTVHYAVHRSPVFQGRTMQVEAAQLPSAAGDARGTRGARLDRGTVRGLAWFAIAAQPVFVAAWIVAGALEPHYSAIEQTISELSARNAEHRWIVTASFLVLAASVVALAPPLLAVLRRRRSARVAAGLFAVGGIALVLTAAFPLDCSLSIDKQCVARFDAGDLTWGTYAHVWSSLLFELSFLLTPFALARALWPRPSGTLALTS